MCLEFWWGRSEDKSALSKGIEKTYATDNLRFSQLAPLSMFEEKNTKSPAMDLPAQIDILHTEESDLNKSEYHFLLMAKGGGSANKTFLHQGTPSLLN